MATKRKRFEFRGEPLVVTPNFHQLNTGNEIDREIVALVNVTIKPDYN